ncbi:MAG: AAA family ATPase [Nocardioides sp.]
MPASPPASDLIGRERETAALSEVLDRAARGCLAIGLVEGEPGIGKSRLLAEVVRDAEARGMRVFSGRAEELERTRPFGVITRALGAAEPTPDPARAEIAALLTSRGGDQGTLTVSSDPGLQFRVVDALADLVEELAFDQPLLIGIDDLQWADPSSLLTLGTMARRLAYAPVALVACFRPAPVAPDFERVAQALRASGANHLFLRPLAEEAVARLVADTIGVTPSPGLLADVAGAAGNPLFVTELLAAMAEDGSLRVAEERAEAATMTLPPTLRLTILRRLSFLPARTLQTLQTASLLGSAFSLTDLSVVTGRPATELSLALMDAIRAHVLEDDGAYLRFRHDLIREAVYSDLPASVRRGLHREAGQHLAAHGAPALQVAGQLSRGAAVGDTDATAWLVTAARQAAPSSPEVAADLLGQAAELMRPHEAGRDRLLAELADNLMWTQVAEAENACRALLDRSHDPDAEVPARIVLGHALVGQGRAAEGLAEFERALEEPGLANPERARVQAWAAMARLSLGDLSGAVVEAEHAKTAALSVGDPLAASMAMLALADAAEWGGHLRRAVHIIDQAVGRADESPARLGHRYPLQVARGHILLEIDEVEEAMRSLEAGRRTCEELGVRWHAGEYHDILALGHYLAGEWDDALAELETSAEMADETGHAYTRILGQSVQALIEIHRNDLRRAAGSIRRALTQLEATGPRYRTHWAKWARALLLEAEGRTDDALAVLGDVWDHCTRCGLALEQPVIGPDLIRLAIAAGDLGRAAEVAVAVEEVAARNDVGWLAAAAVRCRGLADDEVEALIEAVEGYRTTPRTLELALTSEEAAVALAREGQTGRARGMFEQAAVLFERLGATRDLSRTDAALRELGVRRRRHGARGRPSSGWASLTPTELTVADLVAEGLSNPQVGERLYVSRRTVQTHLAHIFAKLGISSRSELAAEVTRRRHPEQAAQP